MDEIELRMTGIAKGGAAVGRSDGKAVFVPGALPGELVRVQVVDDRKRFAHAQLVEVLEASDHRVEPPCPEVERGCGGCDFQHVATEHQRELKRQIVVDAIERIGRLTDVPVRSTAPLAAEGYRTSLRMMVDNRGRAGFRRARSHDVHVVERCLIAHGRLNRRIAQGGWDGAEVTLRTSVATTDVLASAVDGWKANSERPVMQETVAGVEFQVTIDSFWQARPDGAERLVELVAEVVGAPSTDGAHLVDLYGGVGLFAATVDPRWAITLVELNPSSIRDAKVNLAGRDATIVKSRVEHWAPVAAEAVVADPARAGLGKDGVAVVAATGAARVALVSCDPAALGRDLGLFHEAGYTATDVALVDLFPHTSHVETVTALKRR